MSTAQYARCPGGKDKKIKFCCPDLATELEKLQRMVDGGQVQACLDHVTRLEQKYPDRCCLLGARTSLELELGRPDRAQIAAERTLAIDPGNPHALFQLGVISAEQGQSTEAFDLVHRGLAQSGKEISELALNAMEVIAGMALQQGNVVSALAHLYCCLSVRPESETVRKLLPAINSSTVVSVLLKDPPAWREKTRDAACRAGLDSASLATEAWKWLECRAILTDLSQRFPDEPDVWFNLATYRGALGDMAGMSEALHHFAMMDVPWRDAVEAEAKAQALTLDDIDEQVDLLAVRWQVSDVDRLFERLLSDQRLLPMDPRRRDEHDEEHDHDHDHDHPDHHPLPKASVNLLDRPRLAEDWSMRREDIPQVIGEADLYGRQTDRPAYLELRCYRTQLRQGESLLSSLAQGTDGSSSLLSDRQEEILDHESAWRNFNRRYWAMSPATDGEQVRRLIQEELEHRLLTLLPPARFALLEGKSCLEAAQDPKLRVRLRAAILIMELASTNESELETYDALCARLGLPDLATSPADSHTGDLDLARINRLNPVLLSDEQLLRNLHIAATMGMLIAVERFSRELLTRSTIADWPHKATALRLQLQLAHDPARAIAILQQLQTIERANGQSCASTDQMLFQLLLTSGQGEEAQRVLQHIANVHSREPQAMQFLQSITQFIQQQAARMGRPASSANTDLGTPVEQPGIWTPDSDTATTPGKSSKLWTPGMP